MDKILSEPEEVQLSTAPSGIYEVMYADSKSTFIAVKADLASFVGEGANLHPAVYSGGLLAASACPSATASFSRGAVPHGRGKMFFDDTTESYEGEWQFGKRHGHGKWEGPPSLTVAAAAASQQSQQNNADTSVSSSQQQQQMQQQSLPERAFYEGEWHNDTKHGTGMEQFLDGRVYNGEYKNGKCAGVGSLTFLNGDTYRGIFANGVPHDTRGTYSFANGDMLVGPFVDGKRHGTFSVSYTSSPQHSYQATFVSDTMTNCVFIS